MTKQEFLSRLRLLLAELPAEEREDALRYYEDYFDAAGAENEAATAAELHSPETVAADILGRRVPRGAQYEDLYSRDCTAPPHRTGSGWKIALAAFGTAALLCALGLVAAAVLGLVDMRGLPRAETALENLPTLSAGEETRLDADGNAAANGGTSTDGQAATNGTDPDGQTATSGTDTGTDGTPPSGQTAAGVGGAGAGASAVPSVDTSYAAEDVESLSISMSIGALTVEQGAAGSALRVRAANVTDETFSAALDGDTLEIKDETEYGGLLGKGLSGLLGGEGAAALDEAQLPQLVVTVPAGMVFEDIEITLAAGQATLCALRADDTLSVTTSAGKIYYDAFAADDIELTTKAGGIAPLSGASGAVTAKDKAALTVKAGSLRTGRVTAPEMRAEASAGELVADAIDADEVTLKTSAGDMTVGLLSADDISLKASAGSLGVTLAGYETDYDCDVSASAGDVCFNGESYAHHVEQYESNHGSHGSGHGGAAAGAHHTLEISASAGNVNVCFEH